MRSAPFVAIVTILSISAFAQSENGGGIIYGKNHAYTLQAPKGWVLDNSAGVSQGLHAVFYKVGESWQKGETVMYTSTASLEDEVHSTLDKLIEFDLDNFKKNYRGISITDGQAMKLKKDVVAKVKYLSGGGYENYEAIAYIDAGKTGIMIIMTSRTKKGFEDSLKAFEELIGSYMFLGENVTIEKK